MSDKPTYIVRYHRRRRGVTITRGGMHLRPRRLTINPGEHGMLGDEFIRACRRIMVSPVQPDGLKDQRLDQLAHAWIRHASILDDDGRDLRDLIEQIDIDIEYEEEADHARRVTWAQTEIVRQQQQRRQQARDHRDAAHHMLGDGHLL